MLSHSVICEERRVRNGVCCRLDVIKVGGGGNKAYRVANGRDIVPVKLIPERTECLNELTVDVECHLGVVRTVVV